MIKPNAAVRRFDVFAEYTRLEKSQEGMAADEAKGYAIWLAKVVAARKFGRTRPGERSHTELSKGEAAERARRKFRMLGDTEQTDKVFEKEIIVRMGKHFYTEVFAPAIRAAVEKGKSYKEIRDAVRKDWKP